MKGSLTSYNGRNIDVGEKTRVFTALSDTHKHTIRKREGVRGRREEGRKEVRARTALPLSVVLLEKEQRLTLNTFGLEL